MKRPTPPGKILVIGATAGLAIPVCRLLAAQGAHLFLIARNPEKLAALAADLKTRGAAFVDTAVSNLDDTAQHPALLTHAVESLGGCDVALIAPGVLGDPRQTDVDFSAAQALLQTNLLSIISLCTWLAKYFVSRQSGVLAVISSVAGERGYSRNTVYCVSKAGLTAYLSGLRQRIHRPGVTVLTIKPGPVRTAMTAGARGEQYFASADKVGAQILHAIEKRKDILYTPHFWALIMFLLRLIPECFFKKLKI
ncbi:MAG: SDR family NAD(P)-dependent oxidoreductase [Acidobacteriaceae bacterium]|nr:SDR family NAD(P)-dependent oxidoreductase [Acidobacteriaceae bacterium]